MSPRILMCPPDYYGIEYEIKAWMNRARQADHGLAQRQWNDLRAILQGVGATVETLTPVKGLPDLVFTANAALIHGRQAILARFRPPERRGEEQYDAEWLSTHGFQVRQLPAGSYFEGAGDALFCGDTLIAGYRMRSDATSQQRLGEMLGCRVIPLELTDRYYYHLDTCFCPLAAGIALYYPGAFDEYGMKAMRQLIDELVEIRREEAESFAANAVVVGRHVITNTGCPQLHRDLRALGFEPVETPLSEFVKAGGSAKCLTLRLDGEEAAAWKWQLASNSGLGTRTIDEAGRREGNRG
jgi:N-dimethylarginine dimethylaminohydrolase